MPLDTSLLRKEFKVIGRRVTRPDGVDKVTGRAKFGADAFAPGQLVGLILRSPHPHAKIKKIDTSKAEKLTGVKAIVTSADLPDLTNGDRSMRDILENCMARKKVLYDGHAVAAVAAVDGVCAGAGAIGAGRRRRPVGVQGPYRPHRSDGGWHRSTPDIAEGAEQCGCCGYARCFHTRLSIAGHIGGRRCAVHHDLG